MALYSVASQSYVDTIPHREKFELWRSRLTDDQYDAIRNQIRGMIDGSEIRTAGWMSGNDWMEIPWEPVFADACRGNRGAAGRCFGLFVWVVLLEHPETWGFGHYEKDSVPIGSMTYFRVDNPPPR